jgi:putative ABC transport system substrate-binding protein
MKRRAFITLLGGSAVAWPLMASAQEREQMRRIGMLMPLPVDDPQSQRRATAFFKGLQKLGWTEGRNVRIDSRWGAFDADSGRKYASEMVALAPDVIVAAGASVMGPLQEATRSIPIVFLQVTDPVGAGYVASLARPGGNATGFTMFEFGIGVKWLELLKQIAPLATRVAVLRDPPYPPASAYWARSSQWPHRWE